MALDIYGGDESLPVSEIIAGAPDYFRVGRLGKYYVFVTPLGHAFWMRACYYVGYTSDGGSLYGETIATKYDLDEDGSYETEDKWAHGDNCTARLAAWGFNALGEDATRYCLPVPTAGSGRVSTTKLPFIRALKVTSKCWSNYNGWADNPVKDLYYGVSASHYAGGWYGKFPDVFDPSYEQMAVATFAWNDFYNDPLLTQKWCMGYAPDDADYLYGLKRINSTHLGWVALVTNPTQTSNPGLGQTYTDTTVYTKLRLKDWLAQKYGTIGVLNSAWGGATYTTFESAGGWGVGTGLMDEDGGSAWLGDDYRTLDGYFGGDTITKTPANPGVKADLDAFLYETAAKYFQVMKNARDAGRPNHLLFGPSPLEIPKTPVIQGFTGRLDVFQSNIPADRVGDVAGFLNQLRAEYAGPLFLWTSFLAQRHSSVSAPGSTTTDSNSVAMTDTSLFAVNYSVRATAGFASEGPFTITAVNPNTSIALNATATATGSTRIFFPPSQPDYATQATRGSGYATFLANLLDYVGSDGINPVVGIDWWEFTDKVVGGEKQNFGLVSRRDNSYNGQEAIIAAGTDPWGYATGGEDTNYGDFLTAMTAAHASVDEALIAAGTDIYGGYLALPVVGGATGHFRVEKTADRWRLVTPLGNTYWMRGVYYLIADDSHTSYSYSACDAHEDTECPVTHRNTAIAKYTDASLTWCPAQIRRIKRWGFNALAEGADSYATPWATSTDPKWAASGGQQPEKIPCLPYYTMGAYYPKYNEFMTPIGRVWASHGDCTKDIGLRGSGLHWQGDVVDLGEMIDVFDPKWRTWLTARVGLSAFATYFNNPYCLGFSFDDTDYLRGFGAGPDLQTSPIANKCSPHVGWIIAAGTSYQAGVPYIRDSHNGALTMGTPYNNHESYTKYAWRDYMLGVCGTPASMAAAIASTDALLVHFNANHSLATGDYIVLTSGEANGEVRQVTVVDADTVSLLYPFTSPVVTGTTCSRYNSAAIAAALDALNTRWGTGGYYTTWGSTGIPVTGEATGLSGNGTTLEFDFTLAHVPAERSLTIKVGGRPYATDSNGVLWGAHGGGVSASIGTVSYTTGGVHLHLVPCSDGSGDTVSGSPTITGMAAIYQLRVGDKVTVSAGFATTGPFTIVGMASGSPWWITLDENATATVNNVTVAWTAPESGAAITVDYVYNGWNATTGAPVGTGVLDENGKHSWFGAYHHDLYYTNPNLRIDLNNFLYQFARVYFKTHHDVFVAAGYHSHTDPNSKLLWGLTNTGAWGSPARKEIMRAAGEYVDILRCSVDVNAADFQDRVDFALEHAGDLPIYMGIYLTSNQDGMFFAHDRSPMPDFATQKERGERYELLVTNFLNVGRTGFPTKNSIGISWWQYAPNYIEFSDFGLVTLRDNAYDGVEATVAGCEDTYAVPGMTIQRGGELRNYGDCITYVTRANASVGTVLLMEGISVPLGLLTLTVEV